MTEMTEKDLEKEKGRLTEEIKYREGVIKKLKKLKESFQKGSFEDFKIMTEGYEKPYRDHPTHPYAVPGFDESVEFHNMMRSVEASSYNNCGWCKHHLTVSILHPYNYPDTCKCRLLPDEEGLRYFSECKITSSDKMRECAETLNSILLSLEEEVRILRYEVEEISKLIESKQ